MKRSLFIAIVVLLMAALFVSCNAEKSMEDKLVEVTIAGEARALSAAGTSDIDVDDLDWYYTATKTSGYFRTGERTTLTAITKSSNGTLSGATLGEMSTGGWNFCFYGYVAGTTPAANPEDNAVFYQENLTKTITGAIDLEISLSRGAGVIVPVAEFTDAGLFWMYDPNNYVGTVTLVISNNDVEEATYEGVKVAGGKVEFKNLADIELVVGENNLQFDVFSTYIAYGTTVVENLGKTNLTILATSGMTYTITSDENSIDFYAGEVKYGVEIGNLNVPVIETKTITFDSTAGESTVVTQNTPSGEGTTTVVFSENMSGKNLTVETSSAEIADAKFTITGATAVASINLTLSEGNIGANQTATITTFIDKDLNDADVHVYYAGDTTAIDYKDSYEPTTGELVFTTSHFSEFYVAVEGEAQIGTKVYKTLADALAAAQDGSIITLLKDLSFDSTLVIDGRVLTIDLNGKKITSSKDPAIKLNSGNLTLTGTGIVESTAKGGDAICVYGSSTNVENYTVLSVDSNVTLRGGYAGLDIAYGRTHAYGVVVNLNGTVEADSAAIYINGNILDTTGFIPVINLNGATITTDEPESVGIYAAGYARWDINDATITGVASAIEIRAGELSIADGLFTATSTVNPVEFVSNGNGTTTAGAALAIAQHTTRLPITVVIEDGEFIGTAPLFFCDPEDGDAVDVSITVNGGIFNGAETPAAIVRDGGLYASLQSAIDSVAKSNATPVEIRLLRDVKDAAGLATQTGAADANPKNLIIDFGGHTYSMKTPAVGSTGTETQSMHWGAGSVITLRNGFYAVQNDAVGVKMGMQNYANLTIENMQIDLRSVQKTFYEEDMYQAYPNYYMKEVPIFNVSNLNASLLLKDSTVLVADAISWAVLADGPLTIDNCNLKKVAIGDGTVTVSNGEYVIVSYFDNKEVAQNGNVYSLVDATN